jgi:hypothetical protein
MYQNNELLDIIIYLEQSLDLTQTKTIFYEHPEQ